MLDSKTAFKVAFLRRCAEQGFTREETHEVVKQALEHVKEGGVLGDALRAPFGIARDLASKLTGVGLTAALIAPPAVGYGIGRAIPMLTDIEDQDVKEMKKRQLIDEYRRLANELTRKHK